MRVVGVLLVSALMVVPVAIAQQLSKGFLGTLLGAIGLGVAITLTGAVGSFYLDVPSGATIVVLAVGVFLVVSLGSAAWGAITRPRRAPAGAAP
jgi:zinc transport system permease protein